MHQWPHCVIASQDLLGNFFVFQIVLYIYIHTYTHISRSSSRIKNGQIFVILSNLICLKLYTNSVEILIK